MLRLAQTADAQAVHAVLWEAKVEIPLDDTFTGEKYQKWVQELCASGAVWVVDKEGQILGTMIITPATKVYATEISYLAVTSDKRKTGIGRSLIAHAKEKWKEGLRARVKPYNDKIIGLLTSENFRCESGEDTVGWDWVWYSWSLK